jgi:hypothetical protein
MSRGPLAAGNTDPPNEADGTANAAREKLLSDLSIAASQSKINGSQWQVWETEKQRLRQECRQRRNKKPPFLAVIRHMSGMQARAIGLDHASLLILAKALRKIGGAE